MASRPGVASTTALNPVLDVKHVGFQEINKAMPDLTVKLGGFGSCMEMASRSGVASMTCFRL
ncbi:hypothetical protein PIB30_056000 [Stylosanthes scabra]|uniref:Uncharacterized protein n=1 Tax=Stylosanthes scabra TaxID=79078 RepID=A0ABU6ZHW3_9FABA|nr:hypothetical protein [Stylosanthes scabra]